MDVKGFIVYAPTLSVAGLKNKVPMTDLKTMMTGRMPAASSQLVVDKGFVLRHLARGHGSEVLAQTLMADELKRDREAMEEELGAGSSGGGGSGGEAKKGVVATGGAAAAGSGGDEEAETMELALCALVAEYEKLEDKLSGADKGGLGVFLKVDKKAGKKVAEQKRSILDSFKALTMPSSSASAASASSLTTANNRHGGFGGGSDATTTAAVAEAFEAVRCRVRSQSSLRQKIALNKDEMTGRWEEAIAWLTVKGFIVPDSAMPSGQKLLPRGQACAAFADGFPLVVGTVIADGYLAKLSFGEICAWISLFLRETKANDCTSQGLILPDLGPDLVKAMDFSDYLMDQLCAELRVDVDDGQAYTLPEFVAEYGKGPGTSKWEGSPVRQYAATPLTLDRQLGQLVLDWIEKKDITRIAKWIDAALLGTFVKAVMRIVSYVDMVKEVALGLGQFEVHNKLDNHLDQLLGGLVTNESLYLAF